MSIFGRVPVNGAMPANNRGYGFIPTQLNGCVLWLRADRGVTQSNGAVSQWNDQSGLGNNVSQGTPNKQPMYVPSDPTFDGQPSLSFVAVNGTVLTAPSFNVSQPNTVYVIGDIANTASTYGYFDGSVGRQIIYNNGTNWTYYAGTIQASARPSDANVHAFGGVFNGASSALYIDSSGTSTTTANPGANALNGLLLGQTQTVFLQGKIAEFIVYSGVHTPYQVSTIFQYFAARYGLATA